MLTDVQVELLEFTFELLSKNKLQGKKEFYRCMNKAVNAFCFENIGHFLEYEAKDQELAAELRAGLIEKLDAEGFKFSKWLDNLE